MSTTDTTNTGLIAIAVVIYLVVALAVYVWVALALSRVLVKLGEPAWKGWVPFVNILTVYRLGGYSPLWLITLFFPIVQLAGIVIFYFSAHAINRRFGKTPAWTVLAVLVFPVWATILGFGSSRPDGAASREADSPFESRMAGLAPGLPPAVVPPTPPPIVEPIAPAVEAVPVEAAPAEVAPVALVAPVAPADPAPASAAPEVDPWAPPISAIPSVTPPPTTVTPPPAAPVRAAPLAPAPSAPVPAVPLIEPGAPVTAAVPVDDLVDTDKTVIRRRGPAFTLEAAGAEPIPLNGSSVLLGRNPRATGDDIMAQLVALSDPSKTVSKTHARLSLADGSWSITDLASTNGTTIIDDAGTEVELEAGATASVVGSFRLGQLTVVLRQDG